MRSCPVAQRVARRRPMGLMLALTVMLAGCAGGGPAEPPASREAAAPASAPASPDAAASRSAPAPESKPPAQFVSPGAADQTRQPVPSTPVSASPGAAASLSAPAPADQAEWTVLIYVAADNNLAPAALHNLKQMAAVGSTDRVRVVVQADRRVGDETKLGVLNLPGWGTTKRLYIEQGRFRELLDLGQTDMSAPETLRDFVAWAAKTYPANHYALVLWDHGGGWEGYALDESSGKETPMSLATLTEALAGSPVTFDFLGFDACLMASTEVAMALAQSARAMVLVASEELEPGRGWDYTAMLSALITNPGLTGAELGQAVALGYIENLRQNVPRQAQYATLSVTDLTQMHLVTDALNRFVAALRAYVLTDHQASPTEQLARLGQVAGRARFETPAFGRRALTDPGRTYDLGLLAENAGRFTGDAGVIASAERLRAALATAVPFVVGGVGYKGANLSGLSLYLPVYQSLSTAYGQLPGMEATGWVELIRLLAEVAARDTNPPRVEVSVTGSQIVIPGRQSATLQGMVTDDALVTGVVVGIVALNEGQPTLIEITEQPRTYRTENAYAYQFDGRGWYLDGDGAGQLVSTVQWQPGQRAVFGSYRQAPRSRPADAYFVYDQATGELIEGFEVVGGALAALLPSADSRFVPYLYTPDLQPLPGASVAIGNATLRQQALPPGIYLLTVTGFDPGDNASTQSAMVVVQAEEEPGQQ